MRLQRSSNFALTKPIRGLIDKVILTPAPDGSGLDAELRGDITAILTFCDTDSPKQKRPGSEEPGSQLSVVAGAGSLPFRTPVSAFVPIPEQIVAGVHN